MACNHPVGVQLPGHPPGFVAEAVVVKAPVRKAGQASSILARCTRLMPPVRRAIQVSPPRQ